VEPDADTERDGGAEGPELVDPISVPPTPRVPAPVVPVAGRTPSSVTPEMTGISKLLVGTIGLGISFFPFAL
jgi:hypothetical protein